MHSFQCYGQKMCCSCGVEQFFTTFLCLTDFRLGPLKQHSSKLGSLQVFLFVEVWMHTCSPPLFSLCHGRWPVFLVFALLLLIWLWIMRVCVLVSRCLFCGPSVLCRPCLCIACSVVRSLCEATSLSLSSVFWASCFVVMSRRVWLLPAVLSLCVF